MRRRPDDGTLGTSDKKVGGLAGLAWSPEALGDALGLLAGEVGGAARGAAPPLPAAFVHDRPARARWVEEAAAWLGVEAEEVHVTGLDLDAFARGAGPALLTVGTEAAPKLLVVRGAGWRGVRVVGPDLVERRVPAGAVVAALLDTVDPKVRRENEHILDTAGLAGPRRARVRASLLRERLSGRYIYAGWILRLPPSASFLRQARAAGLPARIAGLGVGHVLDYAIGLASWWMIGQGALEGRLDAGWLAAWALLVLTLVPVRAALVRAEGRLALDAGALLKQRLLVGALRLAPEEVRHQGVGQLLGRVIESENVEALAMGGGLLAVFAVLELLLGVGVLAAGAGGVAHAALLLVWVLGVAGVGAVYFRRRVAWSAARLTMTNELVEALVGHRTRLAQEDPSRWHDGEDASLAGYLVASARMDRAAVWLGALAPGGWIVAGLAGLAPALVTGRAGAGALAVAIGGILLAHGSLRKLVAGITSLSGAGIAWEQVRVLFWAAARTEPVARPTVRTTPPAGGDGGRRGATPLLEAHGLSFRHDGRAAAVLDGAHLTIRPGDRILLEGPSGGGKSTLGALLAGLRTPAAGLLLLGGLDRRTLGPGGWRRRVVTAPQFHENHVLGSPLAFNLLMGRSWPPQEHDVAEAEALCRELGLGPLLDRMPSGVMQMVGETGWQLSHGEKSRIYIARALLQGAELVVLDESFAALDPDNVRRALGCVLARASAVLVIAHP